MDHLIPIYPAAVAMLYDRRVRSIGLTKQENHAHSDRRPLCILTKPMIHKFSDIPSPQVHLIILEISKRRAPYGERAIIKYKLHGVQAASIVY